jgi:hypothetical protein
VASCVWSASRPRGRAGAPEDLLKSKKLRGGWQPPGTLRREAQVQRGSTGHTHSDPEAGGSVLL